ncbi:MAG: transporter substrate-binding domain-containing protein [Pseudomonadota bacterium]
MRLTIIGVSLGAAALMSGTALAGETLDRIMASGVLVGASADGFPPVAFLNENNEFDGFDVDVLEIIAGRMGLEAEIVTPSWEAQVAGNWADRWDIAVGSMTPTPARAEVLDFPAIYYYTPAVFIVHEDNTTAEQATDLSGLVIGSCAACTYEDYLRHTLVIDAVGAPPFEYQVDPGEIRTYAGQGLPFDDLRLGDGVRLDAVLTNLPTAQEAIDQGLPFRIVGEPVFYEPLAIAIDKGDPEFAAEVAEIVEGMHADGTLTALSEEWFGVDLTQAD